MKTKLCFLDVETTGMSQTKNGVIQVGGCICAEDAGLMTVLEEFCLNVAPFPTDQIEDEALAVSGVTRAMLREYPPPAVVHKNLTGLFEKQCNKFDKKDKMLFLGYNASFDYGFLRKWFEKSGDKYFGSWFWHPAVDVMGLAMLRLADVRHELPDFRLTTVATHLGVTIGQAHNALDDARATMSIFRKVR